MPNVLILDEPTNHLDRNSRKNLMRMLQGYTGTLIIVSHDAELLRHCINTLWHINKGEIHSFSGNYDDYFDELEHQRRNIERELSRISRKKYAVQQSYANSSSDEYHQSQRASRGEGHITQTTIEQQWESQLINDAEFTANTSLPSVTFDVNNSYVAEQRGQRVGEEVSHFYHLRSLC
ncbi:hypothetical protein BEV13_00900 [Rickettsiella grylli]|uniref:ATP-binding cassette domain-containing protein n=1 Tax=Rickettsiella grylli TaxID=59196 RepID=UPI0008FD6D9C|nr:ATP-binding cassette domain-containing protein [Rickettsiella grylli]OJA01039.1 hypothetical protein BEV13_00900 [Rickettsiella grylli]